MILPFISIEGLAERAYRELGEQAGADRDSYLLGFVDGMQTLSRALREASEAQACPER